MFSFSLGLCFALTCCRLGVLDLILVKNACSRLAEDFNIFSNVSGVTLRWFFYGWFEVFFTDWLRVLGLSLFGVGLVCLFGAGLTLAIGVQAKALITKKLFKLNVSFLVSAARSSNHPDATPLSGTFQMKTLKLLSCKHRNEDPFQIGGSSRHQPSYLESSPRRIQTQALI